MILKNYTTLFFLLFAISSGAQSLIPIYENNLWGLLNLEGEVVIKPKFRTIGDFQEGFAPARENLLFGYINASGSFVVAPEYDFALPFSDGLGKVYIKGKPYFINKKGERIFEHDFVEILPFYQQKTTFALHKNKRYALIDRTGEILMPPSFDEVSPFQNGKAVVKRITEDGQDIYYGVIDETGEVVVDFGEYDRIENFSNGFAKVWKSEGSRMDGVEGVINEDGVLVFIVPEKEWSLSLLRADFTEGVGIIDIVENTPEKDWAVRGSQKGLIDDKGRVIFKEKGIEEITYFHYNRAFVRNEDDKWTLIDNLGRIVKADLPGGLLENKTQSDENNLPFLNGLEILNTEQGLVVIDTTGEAIYPPKMFGRRVLDMNRKENILFYLEDVPTNDGSYAEKWGFWDIERNKMVKPKFDRIFGFTPSGLIHAAKEEEECVVDRDGHILWVQRLDKKEKPSALNIDYMLDGYIYAQSPAKKELVAFGGFSEKGALPMLNDPKQKFPDKALSIIIKTNEKAVFGNNSLAFKAYVVNTTKDTVYFDVEDSRMEMILEAKDEHGTWRNIEFLPRTFCGNSYHMIYLAPDYHWVFNIPKYDGAFKTMLRAKLVYKKEYEHRNMEVLYSNEFEGSVNPAQFWRQRGKRDNMPDLMEN